MKQTKTISLVLIATMTAVTLTACSSEPEPPNLEGQKIFSSVKECTESSEKNCQQAYDKAAISHLMKAPRYMTEGLCKAEGHQQCSAIALAGATVWLPAMVGFMANSRPIYLQKYDETTVDYEDDDGNYYTRELTEDEKKERRVMAGPSAFDSRSDVYNRNSVVVVGGWYPSRGYYNYGFNRGGLTDGIRAANARYGVSTGDSAPNVSSGSGGRLSSRSVSSGGSGRGAARAVSARGGFGGAGHGFGSGG